MDKRSVLIGAATGSALMFMLDPNGGGRRRALVRDQMVRVSRKTRDGLDATGRDLAQRATGIAAATRSRWTGEPASDDTLIERVRAKLGRASSHPRAIDVHVNDGEVTLRGPVLGSEVTGILSTVASVKGVAAVHNEMQAHETSEGIPSLQAEGRTTGPSLDLLQSNWAPATRAMVSAGLLVAGVWMAVSATRESHAAEWRADSTFM
jgi:hypothetical protein